MSSKPKSKSSRIAFYRNNPHIFTEQSKALFPDLNRSDLVFPIKVELRKTYIKRYQKQSNLLLDYIGNETINFKVMTGNQILLMLDQHCEQMKYDELCKALYQIGIHQSTLDLVIDWDQHETIQKVIQILNHNVKYFKKKELAVLVVALDSLKVVDHELWANLQKEVLKCLLTFEKKEFLSVFYGFMNRDNSEVKKMMVELLPKYLREISPNNIMKCFHLLNEQGFMTDYLYEEHFHQMFWKRLKWFGDKNIGQIINIMIEHKYYSDDIELWTENILVPLDSDYRSKTNTTSLMTLRTALNDLEQFLPDLARNIHQITSKIDSQIEFLQTVYLRAQQSKLHNVVQTELEYYKQLQIEAIREKQEKQEKQEKE